MSKLTLKPKLPVIPNKRYFTIGEVGYLCGVRAHVLRYWEQEFPQLKPAKRRGNRRYYQREDVLMVRNIRSLLYDEGYTITGARSQLEQALKVNKTTYQFEVSDAQSSSLNSNIVVESGEYCSITELEYLADQLKSELPKNKKISLPEVIHELKSILSELSVYS
ncbi:MAG: MerR family transcriptional regulator [Gammaproteobacteria bacterium]|nr:MerR family transcriptional regulator [Gammaproteobacteria bacterium]